MVSRTDRRVVYESQYQSRTIVREEHRAEALPGDVIVQETWSGIDLASGPGESVVVGFYLGVASPELIAVWNACRPVRWDHSHADPIADIEAAIAQDRQRIRVTKPEPTPAAICIQALAEGGGDHPTFSFDALIETVLAIPLSVAGFTYLVARCGNDPEAVRAVVFAVYQGSLPIERVKAGPFDTIYASGYDLEIPRCRIELEQAGSC